MRLMTGGPGISFRAIGRSAGILTGSAAGVQAIGVIREVFVAAQVGLSGDYDALLIALVLPTTFAAVLTAGAVTAMVPAYVAARDDRGRDAARRFAGAIGFWIGLGSLLILLLLEAFAGGAIAIAGPGLDPASREAAVGYLQVVSPLVVISGLTAVLYGVCQAEERFAAIAWSGFAGAATTLLVTLGAWASQGLGALALGNLLGPLAGLVVLLGAAARAAIMPRPTLWTTSVELSAFARHAGPLTLSSAIVQVNAIADRAIATIIGPGSVSALRYADVLVRTPIGAIGPAWGTALYPSLVRVARDPGSALSNAVERSLRYALAAFTPIAALTIAVAPVAVSIGYGRGAFTADDVIRTAQAVAAFAPLIVLFMCYAPLTGALNARRRGGALLGGGVLSMTANLALDIVLGLWLGAAGIALSSSLAALLVLGYFARQVARSEADFALSAIMHTLALAVLGSLPVALPIAAVCWLGAVPTGFVPGVIALALFGGVGLLGYVAIVGRLGLEEAQLLERLARKWAARHRPRRGVSG
jgi:putative peptidoglycan lipid II flippase